MNEVQVLLNLWLQALWIDLSQRIFVWNISEASGDFFFLSFFSLCLFTVEENAK